MGLLKSNVSPFNIQNYNLEDHSDATPMSSVMQSSRADIHMTEPYGMNLGLNLGGTNPQFLTENPNLGKQ
jgi:hypothetical protein